MHGDYTRGHEPDRKRGRQYRRVLLQQGRPILDSDVAASVDALLGEVRATARGLGCAAGSPDLGFLVTPGRLVAVFSEAVERLEVLGGTPDAWLDYRHRYLGRFPALQLTAAGGTAARVRLPVLAGGGAGRAALWARVEAPVTIGVNGFPVALLPESPPDEPVRVEFDPGGAALDPLVIDVPAGGEVWLFLLERDESAGSDPAFWVADGTYQVDGLICDARGGGGFPEVSFPASAGFEWDGSPPGAAALPGLLAPADLAPGTPLLAYLEVFERHITHVEDPGIREAALGAVDTTARAQLVGQVKLATLDGALPGPFDEAARRLRDAFADVADSGGRLTVEVPDAAPSQDPCALPEQGGYSGADNRLYRVEVHEGGDLSAVRLKWSRDNGSELFAARLDDDEQTLLFDAGTSLAADDLVEVLSSVVDLGDDALAEVGAGGFEPARRAVGQLARLASVEVAASSDEVAFTLVDPDDGTIAVELDERYGTGPDAALKLRRWHGELGPALIAGSTGPHVLEDGLTVALSATGSYRPGQYWQYEARVHGEHANRPWRPEPHGPERRFAPLALLAFRGAAEPLDLLAWLDERFSAPCDVDADAIAFEGARVGSASDTVQEAIEELFERPPEIVDASCGELIVRTENTLQSVFDTIPPGASVRLCIQPGTWNLQQTVEVSGKGDLIIAGAGSATRLRAAGIDTVLRFTGCGRVRISDLTIEGGDAGAVGDGLAGALAIVDCAGADLERVAASCGDAPSRRMSAVEVRSGAPLGERPGVRVRGCRLGVGNAQVGLLVVNPASADIEDNLVESPLRDRPLEAALADPVVFGRVARLAIDDVVLGETDEFPNDFLLGGDNLSVSSTTSGRNRVLLFLEEWGNTFVAFSSNLGLSADSWRSVLVDNPIPNQAGTTAPPAFVERRLRELRRHLVAVMFGRPDPLTLTAVVRTTLRSLGDFLVLVSSFTSGEQGIVVAGRGTRIDPRVPQPNALVEEPAPDLRIRGNRVLGFVQGIHVGTSGPKDELPRGITYRVTVADNTVHLRVLPLAGERHGIFVGSVFHGQLSGNTVEWRPPEAAAGLIPDVEAIRVHGTFGPLLTVVDNLCVGTARGVLVHAINAVSAPTPGWRWTVARNALPGSAVPETVNW